MGEYSIKNVYIILDGSGKSRSSQKFQRHLVSLFPCLDISSEIYFLSEDISGDFLKIKSITEYIALFLDEYSFYRIHIHPVHPVPQENLPEDIYNSFFRTINPFNREAYLHQGVSRFMIMPILIVNDENELERLTMYLHFLRDRMMIPSIYIPRGIPAFSFKELLRNNKERIYLGVEDGVRQDTVMRTLGVHSVFDDLLTWANTHVEVPIPECRSVVLREEDGCFYNCFLSVSSNRPALNLYSDPDLSKMMEAFEKTEAREKSCLHCAVESISLMRDALKINDREKESEAISFQVGMELVKKENYKKALELFDQSLGYQDDFENTGALLLSKALCHLRLHEMKEAEAALEEAERHMPSSAMIYYYRGMCEFEQRDYIEAIDSFHDVLKYESDEVPLGDLYFHTGLSHIYIEEYDDGLAMMNQAEKFFANKSIVYYYIGICHLGLETLTTALDYLNKALASNPREEDLGNIFFYLGHCCKEMGRYEEAILALEKGKEKADMREDIHNLMGYCYFKLKEHHTAIKCFKKAVAIDPNSAIDYANIGVNLREIGEVDEAIFMLEKALHLDPTIGFARKHLNELNKEAR